VDEQMVGDFVVFILQEFADGLQTLVLEGEGLFVLRCHQELDQSL
jgi:hypothetical protein